MRGTSAIVTVTGGPPNNDHLEWRDQYDAPIGNRVTGQPGNQAGTATLRVALAPKVTRETAATSPDPLGTERTPHAGTVAGRCPQRPR